MAKKNMSMRKRTARAERLAELAWERVKQKEQERRRANMLADGAAIWVTILASRLGEHMVFSKEEIEAAKKMEYLAKQNPDGSVEMILRGLEGAEPEPD